jgi:hypothetical protein
MICIYNLNKGQVVVLLSRLIINNNNNNNNNNNKILYLFLSARWVSVRGRLVCSVINSNSIFCRIDI